MANVLLDTSAWIDFFRQSESVHAQVAQLLREQRVCCLGVIMAELIQGAKSRQEITVIRRFATALAFLEESLDLWTSAGELAFALARAGQTMGLADCFIATCANQNHVPILTLDRHFQQIKEYIDITLLPIPAQ